VEKSQSNETKERGLMLAHSDDPLEFEPEETSEVENEKLIPQLRKPLMRRRQKSSWHSKPNPRGCPGRQ